MSCSKYEEDLALYALHELSDTERDRLQQHVTTCPECRRKLAELQEVVEMLEPTDADRLNDVERLTLENAVLRRLAGQTVSRRRARASTKWARAIFRVAAVLALLTAGYAAYPLVDRYRSPATGTQQSIDDRPAWNSSVLALHRSHLLSPDGLRLIARGRSALTEE